MLLIGSYALEDKEKNRMKVKIAVIEKKIIINNFNFFKFSPYELKYNANYHYITLFSANIYTVKIIKINYITGSAGSVEQGL